MAVTVTSAPTSATVAYIQTANTNLQGVSDDPQCITDPAANGGCGNGATGLAAVPACMAACNASEWCIGFVVHPYGGSMKYQIPKQSCFVSRASFYVYVKNGYAIGTSGSDTSVVRVASTITKAYSPKHLCHAHFTLN